MPTPSFRDEDLLAYAADELPEERAAAIRALLASSPADAAIVARYRWVATVVRADDSVEPPAEVVARAKAIFQPPAAGTRSTGWLDVVDAFIGRLIFDSRLQPAAVRSTATHERVQLAFEHGEIEVDVRAERPLEAGDGAPPRWRVVGQVIAEPGIERLPVAAVTSGTDAVIDETVTDTQLTFELSLPAGHFDLCLGHPDGTIVLPGLHLE